MLVSELSRKELLKRTSETIFSTALDDSASRISLANMKYGLSKIHLLQETLGYEPNASFIAAPDCTITRNLQRWRNGFGYGGKLSWNDESSSKNIDLIPLDPMPNACGMLVGGLQELPEPKEIIKRINVLNKSSGNIAIDGIPITWNYASGNHFINVFDIVPNPNLEDVFDLPPHSFITHSSPTELKSDKYGPQLGLYYHKSDTLQEIAKTLETPFGPIRYLTGKDARDYYDFFNYANKLGSKRRVLAAKYLFNENFTTITNQFHQGLVGMNEIILGCHDFSNNASSLFPLTLRADLPCYLIRGIPNFTLEALQSLNFYKKAKKHHIIERMKRANILPHGGGYSFPHIVGLKTVHEIDNKRYFEVELDTGIGSQVFEAPRELMFTYRGRQVLIKTIELGLGEIVAKMVPRFVIKV